MDAKQNNISRDSLEVEPPTLSVFELLTLFHGNEENLKYYLSLRESLMVLRAAGSFCWCDPKDEGMRNMLDTKKWEPKITLRRMASEEADGYGFTSKQTALEDVLTSEDGPENNGNAGESPAGDAGMSLGKQATDSDSFICGVDGCNQTFTSVAKYESHYHNSHNFKCATCKRTFVSNFLLDIHLQENHDSYFQILSPKIDMYRCLVESCPLKFRTQELRKDHLVTQHKYPANFAFHRPLKSKIFFVPRPNDNGDGGVKKSSLNSSMDVDVDIEQNTQKIATGKSIGNNSRGRSKKVPSTICFGRGAQRGFQHRPRGAKGRHWHQSASMDVDTTVDIEKVDMSDLGDCLVDS
ncbi:unnamed protein product [Lymnaea stagnalis]|uniref:C2H2-type domain-containing protein n=1 Tax=Lymnaea stagnalis TaxID=6523 RepID=A0AAV2IQP6_LYMST